MTSTPALVLTDLEFAYRRNPALRGVSLTVAPGEVVAVTGASGCGKSTLLHCAAGILTPGAGTVRLAGQDLAALDEERRSRLVAILRGRRATLPSAGVGVAAA